MKNNDGDEPSRVIVFVDIASGSFAPLEEGSSSANIQ